MPTSARTGEGLADLVRTVAGVTDGSIPTAPRLPEPPPEVQAAVDEMLPLLHEAAPGLPSARWVAYRLLEGDLRVRRALETGELASLGVSRPKETTP